MEEKVAGSNLSLETIETDYDFGVQLLVADRPISKGEIFLFDYGPSMILNPSTNMNPFAMFNSRGEIIAMAKMNQKTAELELVEKKTACVIEAEIHESSTLSPGL